MMGFVTLMPLWRFPTVQLSQYRVACLQILALICMERPVTMHPDDIRDEKTKVIRAMRTITEDKDVVVGQYTAANGKPGYLDDEGVPNDSNTATYAAVRLWCDNERWEGVPMVIKAGALLLLRQFVVAVHALPSSAMCADNDGAGTCGRQQDLESVHTFQTIICATAMQQLFPCDLVRHAQTYTCRQGDE